MSEEEIVRALLAIRDHFREQHLYGEAEVSAAVALIVEQQSAIQRVRDLHGECSAPGYEGKCAAEGERLPCATIRVLDGAPLPITRTEAGWPHCSTCEGGGCPDCTDGER